MKNAQKPDYASLNPLINLLREMCFVIPDFQPEIEWRPCNNRRICLSTTRVVELLGALLKNLSVLLFVIISVATNAFAQGLNSPLGDPLTYKYHPDSVLSLGFGLSPNDITQPKVKCITATQVSLDSGPPSTELTVNYVRNFEEFVEESGMEVKADVNLKVISEKIDLQTKYKYVNNENNVTVLVKAVTDFGRWGLDDTAKLTESAKALLTDPKKFEAVCGSRYVAIERRGAFVSAAITISNVSNEFKESITSNLTVSGGTAKLGASAIAKFNSEMTKAAKQDRLRIEILGNGGGGLGNLSDLLKGVSGKPDALTEVAEGLAAYVRGFTNANAAPYSYTVASMEQFGWDPSTTLPWTDVKEQQLRDMAAIYRYLVSDVSGSEDYLSGGIFYRILGDSRRAQITSNLLKTKEAIKTYAAAYQECKDSKTITICNVPDVRAGSGLSFEIPGPPKVYFRIAGTNNNAYLAEVTRDKANIVLSRGDPRIPRMEQNPNLEDSLYPIDELQLQQLQVFVPGATSYKAFLQVQGDFLEVMRIIFVGTDGIERSLTMYEPAGGQAFYWRDYHQQPSAGLDRLTIIWMNNQLGLHEGTFYLQVKDTLGRTFRIAFLDVSWNTIDHRSPDGRLGSIVVHDLKRKFIY